MGSIMKVQLCKQYLLTLFSINVTYLAGAGHWLVAYRKAEEQKQRKVHRRVKGNVRTREDDRGTRSPHFQTLDRAFLVRNENVCKALVGKPCARHPINAHSVSLLKLRLHCVDEPFELCSVDISEQQLNSVSIAPRFILCFILSYFQDYLVACDFKIKDSSVCGAQVKPEDLKVFDNVAYIDASDNFLSLGDCSRAVYGFIFNMLFHSLCL